jgi:hypothetical protein
MTILGGMRFPRLGFVAACSIALLLPSGALAASTPPPNLVVNGDAETGVASDSGAVVPTAGWTTTAGQFTEVLYSSSGFPGTDFAAKIGGGKNFFAGGPDPDNGISSATQLVSVASYAGAIDAGTEPVTLSALIGGYATQNDNATISATFLDANNAPIGTALGIGPVDSTARAGITTLLPETSSGTVPAGTRSISLSIVMTRTDGAYDDGYVDNVSLTLGAVTTAPTTPAANAPVAAPGPPDVALQIVPGGKGFRVQVQYTVPKACTKSCAAHAQLRIRSGGRVYDVKLPGAREDPLLPDGLEGGAARLAVHDGRREPHRRDAPARLGEDAEGPAPDRPRRAHQGVHRTDSLGRAARAQGHPVAPGTVRVRRAGPDRTACRVPNRSTIGAPPTMASRYA